jgi:hypothetical protein
MRPSAPARHNAYSRSGYVKEPEGKGQRNGASGRSRDAPFTGGGADGAQAGRSSRHRAFADTELYKARSAVESMQRSSRIASAS